jgi:serine beta-lactamase-like protein LACTB, mitochondrial
MKIRTFLPVIILIASIVVTTSCKKPVNDIHYDRNYIQEIKQTREAMEVFMIMNSIPGAQITIYKNGEMIYSEGFGFSSNELKTHMYRDTKLRLGSSTGILTSLAYHKLVENGTLHPDSGIYYYLPDFPRKNHNITLENLIQNTSGIREHVSGEIESYNYNFNLELGLDMFKNDDLLFTPGEYQTNSIFDYNLLGVIMEKATGKNFEKIIQELVTDTLQLGNTIMDNPFVIVEGRSDFYDMNMVAIPINAPTIDLRSNAPSMGYLSTTEDLAKFGNDILHSPLVSDEIREKLFAPLMLNQGFVANMSNGWQLLNDNWKRKIYASSGNVKGGGSSLLVFPDDDLVIAIMINISLGIINMPDYQIATFFLEKTADQMEYEKYLKEKNPQQSE